MGGRLGARAPALGRIGVSHGERDASCVHVAGYAGSDGFLVVYYPHLIVLPEFQGRGVGTEILKRLRAKYEGFHQHMLVADGRAIDFYKKCGFERAGKTEPMWIYAGHDH